MKQVLSKCRDIDLFAFGASKPSIFDSFPESRCHKRRNVNECELCRNHNFAVG